MKEGEWDQVNKQELVETLWKRARYAVNSYSKSLDNLSIIALIGELLDEIVENGGKLSEADKQDLENYVDDLETV